MALSLSINTNEPFPTDRVPVRGCVSRVQCFVHTLALAVNIYKHSQEPTYVHTLVNSVHLLLCGVCNGCVACVAEVPACVQVCVCVCVCT